MRHVELVGILNVTPDSFSGDGIIAPDEVFDKANQLVNDGASYIDVGAQSTRPGASYLGAEEEWSRLKPVLPGLSAMYGGQLSIDTYHPEVVRRAARDIGHIIVNDVTGFNNTEMIDAVAELRLPCIVSHLPEAYGRDIQQAHRDKPVESVGQVTDELLSKCAKMMLHGIHKDMIILDPGIGFGKTMELNWKLLEFAKQVPNHEVMIGYSRKRFLGKNRMDTAPNVEAGKIAAAAGARYLRVHDVAAHRQAFN